jgi:hypothetical protein
VAIPQTDAHVKTSFFVFFILFILFFPFTFATIIDFVVVVDEQLHETQGSVARLQFTCRPPVGPMHHGRFLQQTPPHHHQRV